LPQQIAYIILTSLQIIPRFQSKAQTILDAQRSRGLETEGTLIHRLRMIVPLISPLIMSSIIELDERAIALEARAFSRTEPKTSLITLEDSRFQSALRWLLFMAMIGIIILRLTQEF
jgi:energy-coupling factor transport system permease protein